MEIQLLTPAIFLMGPTASGKTTLAIGLAKALNGEIISVDSVQVYKGMDIGTAKPDFQERDGVSHHLIDILDPSESFSTGEFRAKALLLMDEIRARHKIPILVGGTMLYFNTLINGLAVLPKANAEIRTQLDEDLANFGSVALHQRLITCDPQAAARIHPNDPQRVQRALEVFALSGKPLSSFFTEESRQILPFKIIKLIIAPTDRAVLHAQIATRFKKMLAQGLIDEVSTLFIRGDLNEKMPAIRAVGYRQVWSYLQGEMDKATMTEKAIIATRQLAKRQFTWLRRETDAFSFQTGETNLLQNVLATIAEANRHGTG